MIKFGLIGRGMMLSQCASELYSAGANVCAVCDMGSGWASALADQYNIGSVYMDYRDLLCDLEVEALYLFGCDATAAMEAAESGKHIFWTLPQALSKETLQQIQQCADRRGITLQLNTSGNGAEISYFLQRLQ